jgi:hypothetical protein
MVALRKKTREAEAARKARLTAKAEENAAGIVAGLETLAKSSRVEFNRVALGKKKYGYVELATNIPTKNAPEGLRITVQADGDIAYDGKRLAVCPEFDKDFLGESFKKFHKRRNLVIRRPRMTEETLSYVTRKARAAKLAGAAKP